GGSAGVVFYNNTILSETQASGTSNSHWRNNLFLGENSAPAIWSINTYTNYTSSDYNGFRPNPGAAVSFQWNSPPMTTRADYTGLLGGGRGAGGAAAGRGADRSGAGAAPAGRGNNGLESRAFPSLQEYSKATSQDSHS